MAERRRAWSLGHGPATWAGDVRAVQQWAGCGGQGSQRVPLEEQRRRLPIQLQAISIIVRPPPPAKDALTM